MEQTTFFRLVPRAWRGCALCLTQLCHALGAVVPNAKKTLALQYLHFQTVSKKTFGLACISLLAATMLALPMSAQKTHNREVAKHLDIFNSLYAELDLNYVDTLDAEKVVGDAILYMLDRLDPYTEYYTEEDSKDLRQLTTGKYAGIGSPIHYHRGEERCVFSFPYEGMPAQTAGVRHGDIILSIDGKDVGKRGKTPIGDYTSSVSKSLRGSPGTTFNLTVKRPGAKDSILTLRLTRRTIELPSVAYARMLADSIGFIELSGYTEHTARDLRRSIVSLKKQGMKSLILDLRGNGGGLMREAVSIVNFFLPRGKEVLRTKGKVKSANAIFRTTAEPLDTEMPIAVLVDYATASAAEITSGALQDYDRAVVIGRRTYGKGLVQEPRSLPYGSMLKLTTSKYYIPSGRCVQAYDFKNRNEDGLPTHLPDSLSKEFRTAAGRIVRDGGGITPDIIVKTDSTNSLFAELAASDALFDFCVNYCNTHAAPQSAADFRLSDEEYAAFKQFICNSGFTYERSVQKLLDGVRKIAALEGYGDEVKPEFDALEAKLTRNLDADLDHHEHLLRPFVEEMIITAYLHHPGAMDYRLTTDKDVKAAREILLDPVRYNNLLSGEKQGAH